MPAAAVPNRSCHEARREKRPSGDKNAEEPLLQLVVLGGEDAVLALPAGDDPCVHHPREAAVVLVATPPRALGGRRALVADDEDLGAADAEADVLVPVVVRAGEPLRLR